MNNNKKKINKFLIIKLMIALILLIILFICLYNHEFLYKIFKNTLSGGSYKSTNPSVVVENYTNILKEVSVCNSMIKELI